MLTDEDKSEVQIAASWGEHLPGVKVGDRQVLDPELSLTRCIGEAIVVHQHDLRESAAYKPGNMTAKKIAEQQGVRTIVFVPLLTKLRVIGCIALSRLEVEPFRQEDIALLEIFAAQAVIAIENARQFDELQSRLEREAASRDILDVVSRSRGDVTPVFDTILEHACKLCRAQSAFMVVVDETGTHMSSPAQRGATPAFAAAADQMIAPLATSQLAAAQAIRERRVIRIDDVADTELYRSGDSIRVNMVDVEGIHSILTVPLLTGKAGLGAIVLYRKKIEPFADEDITLVESFAAQAVIAIENVHQFKALESLNAELGDRVEEQVGEIERMGRLKRFLPAAVADTVVSSGSEELLKSHRSLLGVLFCDIRGFTAFCESAEPEETIEVLQTYHEEMGKLISEHGAGVDHRMGDGIMVLFNDPLPCDDPAGNAVRLAVSMRARMTELSKNWKRIGHRLGFGVGVSLGYATVGMVGYEGRSDYTASGTAVNLAARLCDLAADGEILLSPRAYTAVEDDHSGEPTGEVSLKGIREPVEVYRLLDT
jgi:class 3 adenylate cyclase/putative methionine-R-sulfoxide reductase with GAF domain